MTRAGHCYVLGVDAGNSKTVALVATAAGEVLGFGRSGPGDVSHPDTGSEALEHVAEAVTAALAEAGVDADALVGKGFSMAGADWPEDFTYLAAELARWPWGQRAKIVNDAVGALLAGAPSGVGVAVVCGTYATSAGRNAAGESWHAGFWQESGGAYRLGEEALRAAVRAELGIDPPTALQSELPAAAGLPDVEALLHERTARASRAHFAIAALARTLLDCAAAGDATARRIVAEQGALHGDYAVAAAAKVGLAGAFPLVFAGGVFRHPSNLFEGAIAARVRRDHPDIHPTRSSFEPVVGALLLALGQTGARADATVLERLRATLPPAERFAT